MNEKTGEKGAVGEEPTPANKYNQNFRNIFCGCKEEYDPHTQRGTMFQCLGLGFAEDGGCGEDWWHPECILGVDREDYKKSTEQRKVEETKSANGMGNGIVKHVSVTSADEPANGLEDSRRPSVVTAITGGADGNDVAANEEAVEDDDDTPLPPGFPQEDDFEYMLCYKCVAAFPWIKRYAGTPGFLPAVYYKPASNEAEQAITEQAAVSESKKRKASDDQIAGDMLAPIVVPKRQKSEEPTSALSAIPEDSTPKKPVALTCKLDTLPPAPPSSTPFTLFMKPDFRDHLCRCPNCFPFLKPHPQLREEEDTYEPPVSEDGDGGPSVGTGSLLDRGEAAFSNIDRVRAIEGAMVYAHLKDKVKAFLQPFAESGQAVGAEDIKAYFEKLRGDEAGIKAAAGDAEKKGGKRGDGGDGEGDSRKEQSGY